MVWACTGMMGYPQPWVSAAAQPGPVAGYAAVAPILQRQCASCHNPAGGAPFNLLSYEDAKQWSGQILEVTQSRYMPPWLPAPGKGEFVGERRLSDAELAAVRAWVGAGAPPDGTAAPAQPATPAFASGWSLGPPDAVLAPETTMNVPVSGPDQFTTLVVPVRAKSAARLRAIEIRPSDPQAVRSVLVSFDEDGRAEQNPDWKQGIAGMEPPPVAASNGAGLVFWSPGAKPMEPHAGAVWALTPKTDLLLTTHVKTTGKKTALQLQIGLYYEKRQAAGTGSAAVLRLEHPGAMEIPAGAAATTLEDTVTVQQPLNVSAIYPRAHFLARSFDAYATTPAGKQVWLVSIPKWDVDWLEVYRYKRPVVLPKGSVIHWKVTYDNSAENPHNPSDPPVTVHGGSDAKDEVDGLMLEVEPPAGVNAAAWRKSVGGEGGAALK